jgi:hypothetical protein
VATEYPLSLVIRAVDKATAPLRQINQRLQKFTAPMRKLNNSFRALSEEAGIPRLMKGLAGVGSAISGVGREALALGTKITALAAGASYALYRIVRGAVDAGDKLGEMAARVGLSVDAYAQLQFAAAQADVEQEAFAAAMDQFNKRLGEARAGTGSLLSFLERVSPTLALQVKGAKSTEEALALMTGAFEKVKDPARRAALANAAFGRSGLQMGQFLGQGNAAIDEQRQRFFALAGSQEAFARGAGELDNAMRRTEAALGGVQVGIMARLFPALTKLADAITRLVERNGDKLVAWAEKAGKAIEGWVDGGGLDRLVTRLGELAGQVRGVVAAFGGLKGLAIALAVVMGAPLIASVASLGAAFLNLGAAALPVVLRAGALLIPVIWKMVAGLMALNLANPLFWIAAVGAALAGAAYLVWKHWEPIKAFFLDLWEKVKGIASAVGRFFGGGTSAVAGGAPVGAAAAVPSAGGTARVAVAFENLPKGARASVAPRSTVPLDLSMGWAMVGP